MVEIDLSKRVCVSRETRDEINKIRKELKLDSVNSLIEIFLTNYKKEKEKAGSPQSKN